MGPACVLSAPDGPHVGPINLAISVVNSVRVILPYTVINSTSSNLSRELSQSVGFVSKIKNTYPKFCLGKLAILLECAVEIEKC